MDFAILIWGVDIEPGLSTRTMWLEKHRESGRYQSEQESFDAFIALRMCVTSIYDVLQKVIMWSRCATSWPSLDRVTRYCSILQSCIAHVLLAMLLCEHTAKAWLDNP